MMSIKCYSELILLPTFEERFKYLKLNGTVGSDTFGWQRYLNQQLYSSTEWKKFKRQIIIRDLGCDLGCEGFYIPKGVPVFIHHINPISIEDILERRKCLMDPENVITTIFKTHNAIHYGSLDILTIRPIERTPFDTCPWRRSNDR